MVQPLQTNHKIGQLQFVRYDFVSAGDELPMHTHDETTAHVTFILRGSFKIEQPSHDDVIAYPGDIYHFAAGQPHAIQALDPGGRIINQTTAPPAPS